MKRRVLLQGAAGAAFMAGGAWPASAQSRAETLRYVTGATINTLDTTMPGATREAFGLSMNVYDRLFSFGRKKVGDNWAFDPDTIRGELAKSYSISPDSKVITITLRPDATWHDGTPVTAEDVKWSLDRHVTAKSLAAPQFTTGSLTNASQFKIVDPQTVTVTLDKPDRLALANLCVCYAIMINSKLAKKHATADDPWAMEWMKTNTAASGAYIIDSHKPGESTVLRRNEKWVGGAGGALPSFKRIIIQTVPEPATRANLIERGDADLAIDLAASDLPTIEKSAKSKVVSIPQTNGFTHISMNTQMAPFDNLKVRQAVAMALPYEDMFKAAIFSRGTKLYGGTWATVPPDASFPQAIPNKTDLAKAKALLAEAGHPNGFSTTFAFTAGQTATAEPMAALVKESLGKIGIQVEIQKKPDAEFNTLESEKKMPLFTDGATAWLPYTYYFFYLYFTRDQRWNFASFKSKKMEDLTLDARYQTDKAKYEEGCKQMIELFNAETPLIMLWQPNHDAVMAKSVDGYTYQFYRQADFRDLKRV
ncbi:ABC transporter substrate-binding protein [Reyranella sp.]|jgi:peptide/nickel transport system substrate-binding protein|uniref:ABC transporter substrate-binding protein n=1 Tax=Reyranella sp. TaxID=1929291 RepID=UPI000BD0D458|nr:ABC transporter substrate-binding protein [Reyranella sp.]OYY38664.1 MAG: ABC transporter substrate-binding protein [Rhodospirillales bacterium 35-66-84]OYZ91877.1 MAG: ABC transporter substrate-binding protein [Rhodospirillales bacterium 24-66-33]OZB21649.1 MAG: ABC transporter substrate-binding protein [Rhodospirillales bacterium 39-66-50]HQS15505.1 ABC transporter substrate-binding protein [Reyranella sp.]HQT12031.1 ABC transporter substrate-binding protein [Reyranella sp.]